MKTSVQNKKFLRVADLNRSAGSLVGSRLYNVHTMCYIAMYYSTRIHYQRNIESDASKEPHTVPQRQCYDDSALLMIRIDACSRRAVVHS